MDTLEESADDHERLQLVLEERRRRSRDYFDQVAADWDVVGSDFTRGVVRLHAVNTLVPRALTVADVGCGTGYMARALVRCVDKVILIDHSEGMLEQARRSLEPFVERVDFRRGELDRLPLGDGEVDAAFANMVMHHVPDLSAALRELYRATKPGGTLVITDLLPHKEAWMTEEMADLRLGLDPTDLARRVHKVGFENVRTDTPDDALVVKGSSGRTAELPMFLLTATRPGVLAETDPGAARSRPIQEGISP